MQMRYLKDVVTLKLDEDKCNGCALCLEVCPQEVFALSKDERKVELKDRDACMECGACARNCPRSALQVRAGVGCANAILNSKLGRSGDCCCTLDGCTTTTITTTTSSSSPNAGSGCGCKG